jgi:hypothetical protein
MKRSRQQIMRLMAAGFLLVYPSILAFGQDSLYRFRPGFHLSEKHPPNTKQLRLLLDELRGLTGFAEIQIKSNGDLSLGNRSLIEGGSEIARNLLADAIGSKDSFALEKCDHSATIAFAQIESTLVYRDATDPVRHDWSIRIDFADFKELRGNEAVIKSFGPGMSLMHELVHAILDYPDPLTANDQLGQCERHLNLIRAELGLPLRQNYFPSTRYAASPDSIPRIFQAEITFARRNDSSKHTYSLTFNLDRVFDVGGARPRSLVYSDLARLFRK